MPHSFRIFLCLFIYRLTTFHQLGDILTLEDIKLLFRFMCLDDRVIKEALEAHPRPPSAIISFIDQAFNFLRL